MLSPLIAVAGDAVLIVFISMVFTGLGLIALGVAWRSAPHQHNVAVPLADYGWRSFIFGLVIG